MNQEIFAMLAYWVVTACLVAGIVWVAATQDARVLLFVVATVVWLLASIGFWARAAQQQTFALIDQLASSGRGIGIPVGCTLFALVAQAVGVAVIARLMRG